MNLFGLNTFLMWIIFILLILVLLFIDLIVTDKKTHEISIKESLIWSAVWFVLAIAFGTLIWFQSGHDAGLKFLTGYLIEKSLSVDNLFVILLIFNSFRISSQYQHKVLFFGILGALIMRGVMIGAGAALVSKFQWILYLFGLFLIYTGFKMFFKKSDDFDPHDSFVIKLLKKFVHVSKKVDMHNFFVKENGKSGITTLFVALIIIEISDVVFAFDSIPAIFAITTDPFIVFTSNIFAILGLRSLYFVIAKFNDIFHYLNVGLAIVLIFIGIKMLIEPFLHISIIFSLLFIALVIGSSMAASLIYKKHAAVK